MNITKTLTDTFTWVASSDIEVDLPLEGLITRIDFEVYLDMSATIAGDCATYGLWRAIEGFKIQGGSGINYFNMGGKQSGLLWHYLNLLDFPARSWRDLTADTQYALLRFHAGSRPRDIYGRDNPFDLTAAIPAFAEGNLKAIWTTGATDDTVDDTLNISAMTIRVTVYEVLGGEAAWNRMIPISSHYTYNPAATKPSLGGQVDVPIGNHVRRIALMCQDSTALTGFGRLVVGDQITELALLLPKISTPLIYQRTRTMQLGAPKFDGMQVVNTPNVLSPWAVEGFHCLDLRQYDDRDYGLDTRNLRGGDVKLAMTVDTYSSSDREIIFYDQVQRYGGAA